MNCLRLRSLSGLLFCLLILAWKSASAQAPATGSIFGQVTEAESARELTNVLVRVVGSGLQVRSGSDGRYSLLGMAPGQYKMEFILAGYERRTLNDVPVMAGEATRTDVALMLELFELPLLEVMADPLADYGAELRLERQGSVGFLEPIGEEMFSRLAAGDAAEIVTKATGISVVEGKTAVVRGLSDRYNLTLLNGGEIPSSDPYRKSAQLDMFPSETLEAVVIHKTFTPDLPGGFSGAMIDLKTKSFPPQFVFKSSFGVGYNTQSTGNEDFLTYPGGDLDAFAMDDGTRALPDELANVTGGDLNALYSIATSRSRTITLEEKTAAANQLDSYIAAFGTPQMGPTTEAPPPDHDFGILVGDTVSVAQRPLGYFAGISYERDFRFYDDGVRRRYSSEGPGLPQALSADFDDARSVSKAQWSALANLAFAVAPEHEFSYGFLYSQVAEDQARQQEGKFQAGGGNQFENNDLTHLNTLQFTERNLASHQLLGDHLFPALGDLKLDWLLGFATTYQSEPDLRYFNAVSTPADPADPDGPRLVGVGSSSVPTPANPTRFFRDLEDENLNGKFDLTLPIEDARALEWKVKGGANISRSERSFAERTFSVGAISPTGTSTYLADPTTFPYNYLLPPLYTPAQLVVEGNRSYYYLSRRLGNDSGNNFYQGSQDIDAFYGMVEIPLTETLRLTGGVRYESTRLQVDSTPFTSTEVRTGLIDQSDFLPAVNLSWNPRTNLIARICYAETIARPTYREFADYRGYDSYGDEIVQGNPNLVMSSIRNYDLRLDWFTATGGLVSAGVFYKTVENPIEKYNADFDVDGEPIFTSGDFVTFLNSEEATVWGLEVEARQNLGAFSPVLDAFSAGFNFAWINSEVPLEEGLQASKGQAIANVPDTRPLYDQSPYIINADLSYDNVRSGTTVTVIFGYAAERLALINSGNYDIYEQGAPILDLVLSQRWGDHWKLKFSAENLLNPEVTRAYNVDDPADATYLYSSYTRGVTFGLSVGCEF